MNGKKKYSINWEDDEPISFEVDGVQYDSLDDIPDEYDRLRLESMVNAAEDAAFDSEFAKMEEKAKQTGGVAVEKIILSIFTIVAVLMLLIAGVATISNILKISRKQSTNGQVVEVISRREYVNEQDRIVEEYYYPVVIYVSSDEKRHRVQMNEGSSSPSHEVGDQVVVLYEPNHPLDARIRSFGSSALMWILPIITGILGITFLGGVLVVYKLMPPAESP